MINVGLYAYSVIGDEKYGGVLRKATKEVKSC